MANPTTVATATKTALGSPSDWQIRRPAIRRPRLGLHQLGPLAVVASSVGSWFAFAGATGDGGNVAFGLFIGAVSIILMAWSFLLAVRVRFLERFFGGLDSMYRVHRWAGTFAVVAMFLHTSIEPEIEGGILGASRSLADSAEDLAGTGQTMLYILVAISLLRWFPYRWWRWTHKLLGIPFAFACFHFFTAEKPYANGSAWGWYFGAIMVAGLVSYVARVIGKDIAAPGRSYIVDRADVSGSTLDLELSPVGRAVEHHAGQFAILKVDKPGMREPHIFTIASPPDADNLRFFIRDLGDWTAKMQTSDLVGARVTVEGPYGMFEPTRDDATSTVWIAGGVGITPFLSAAGALQSGSGNPPTLHYLVRSESDAMALDVLQDHHDAGRLNLVVHASAAGRRFRPDSLSEHHPNGLQGAHVAVCGPASLVTMVDTEARRLGASFVEREDFDIRQGFGPDLSRQIDEAATKKLGRNSSV